METLHFKARIGPDGVLRLSLPVGIEMAGREVEVVIEPAGPRMSPEEWRESILESGGRITDPTFRRHEQGEYEERDPWP